MFPFKFSSSHIKKLKKDKINFNSLFSLSQYTQNIILMSNQCKKLLTRYFKFILKYQTKTSKSGGHYTDISSQLTVATFQGLKSPMWLV